jgi:membrane-associated protein
VTGLSVVVAWLAGVERMPWPRFALWNALGGIAWATPLGLLAYWIGSTSSGVFGSIGLIGVAVAVVAVVGYIVTRRFAGPRQRRRGGSAAS